MVRTQSTSPTWKAFLSQLLSTCGRPGIEKKGVNFMSLNMSKEKQFIHQLKIEGPGKEGKPLDSLFWAQCPTLGDPVDCRPPGSSVHGILQAKSTGMGCHALLQGIFPTQGSNQTQVSPIAGRFFTV